MKRGLIISSLLLFCLCTFAQQQLHVPGEIIVKIKPGVNINLLVKDFEILQKTYTRLRVVREVSGPMRAWLLGFDPSRIDERVLLNAFVRHPSVEMAQFNHYIRLRDTIPNDPHFPSQWQWRNLGNEGGKIDADVDAEQAWGITTGGLTSSGDTIVVCVVEAANREHADLKENLWYNWNEIPGNGIDDDGNGYIDDFNGWNVSTKTDVIKPLSHGTAVSGLIGARGNNGLFVAGINWKVKLMHVDFSGITEANALEAYTYPWQMRKLYNETGGKKGAFIVAANSSWGLDNRQASSAPLWCAFYDSLGVVGIISCAATTNNNVDVDKVGDLPSTCGSDFLLIATATNNQDSRNFSGYGLKSVDVAAPGSNVASLTTHGAPSSSTGTSFAAPIVAGIVALLYSSPCSFIGPLAKQNPAAAATYIKESLVKGVDVLPGLVNEVKFGGRVNAFKSLQVIMSNCGPCPEPIGLGISNVIDTSALTHWFSTDSSLHSGIRWRITGDSEWTVRDSISAPYFISSLKACTHYEIQVRSACADTISGYSNPVFFKTDGCCEPPLELSFEQLKDTSVLIRWNPVLAAKSYNLHLKVGDSLLIFSGIKNNSHRLTKLTQCTKYNVQLQTVCDTGATQLSKPLLIRTFGCGPCIDSVYCSSRAESSMQEWIANVTVDTFSFSSGSNEGYGDFTGKPIELSTYRAYPISLTPGYESSKLSEYFGVWIDFNQDGDFIDPGEEVFSFGPTNKQVSGQIIIPSSAKAGLSRMRVSMRWNQKPLPCSPTFNFGEVEDYCVLIKTGSIPVCSVPDSLIINEPDYTKTNISWQANSEALTYEVRYQKTLDIVWSTKNVIGQMIQLSDLEPCTNYRVQVRSSCVEVKGTWTDTLNFKTKCFPACDAVPAGIDTISVTDSTLTLKWKSVPDAIAYQLAYKLPTDTLWKSVETNKTEAVLKGLDSCRVYQFTVQALCTGGRMSARSSPIDIKSFCLSNTISNPSNGNYIQLYPNPFSNELWAEIKTTDPGLSTFELFDFRSVKLFSRKQFIAEGTFRLQISPTLMDISDLLPGVYFLKVQFPSTTAFLRVVKN